LYYFEVKLVIMKNGKNPQPTFPSNKNSPSEIPCIGHGDNFLYLVNLLLWSEDRK